MESNTDSETTSAHAQSHVVSITAIIKVLTTDLLIIINIKRCGWVWFNSESFQTIPTSLSIRVRFHSESKDRILRTRNRPSLIISMDASTRAASTVIEAEEVVLPGGELKKGPVYVSIVQDTITDITSTRPPTVKDVIKTHLLTPGFIDLHIHGLGGTNDVIDFWSNPGYTLSLLPMAGTTSCLATIVFPKSSSQPTTLRLFDKLKDVIGRTDTGGAVLEGINAEGPLVNDFGGLPESERHMTETDFELLIDSIPSIKIMTISPHIEARHNYKRLKLLIKK
ncbi:PREDICTED: uncharacterized protein LOC109587857 [Amphimedon queenslandica]|uniref:Amidohydrolase-related domain-containing protein n=3 Tax=Amphimedon queenslandica TaxID=400682 RepID=A0AAN0JRD3_AMPQE|nr:PREDICTED: uncharacterized protein LOC109587857 [Amphimedon queenslandica]|eukprot:XP_019859635.1 PREDICTED: uncharacterized protein LOC109587857 [Amphimedon queenslandica]